MLERANAASAGPWEYVYHDECLIKPHVQQVMPRGGRYTIATPVHSNPLTEDNMRFVAHARTDLPRLAEAYLALLDECESLRKDKERLDWLLSQRHPRITSGTRQAIDAAKESK